MPKPHEMPHPTLSEDTDPEAEKVQLEILRRMPAWKKFELVSEAIETSRVLAMAGLRHRHPDAPPEELHRRFLDLWLGKELAFEVYGPIEQVSRRLP